jgi:hypothetical protein
MGIALASTVVSADFDFEVSTTLGMQTRIAELQSNHGFLHAADLYDFHVGYNLLRETLGLDSAEFVEIEVKSMFDLGQHSEISAYVSGRVLQEYLKTGVKVEVEAPLGNQNLKIKSGIDAFLGFSSAAEIVDPGANLYTNISFQLAPALRAIAEFSLPIASHTKVKYKAVGSDVGEYNLTYYPSYHVGLQFVLWPFDLTETIEEIIVQEPVAISVEQYEEDAFIYDFDDEEDMVYEEQPIEKGWFAEFIEFLVRLFKF